MAYSSQAGRAKNKTVLRHLSLPESVHEILRARILNNEIPAGAPLLEVALSEEFGVSRTTIRAAMRELQAERLIEIAPRRGSTVIRMSEEDAREVCFARFTLEEVSLRGLNRARRRELADRMEEVLQVMELCAAKGDLAGMVEADTDLHQVIVEASGHPLIVDMWVGLNGQMGALMRSSLDRQRIELAETVRRHAELITAFREQSATAVANALREHYVNEDDGTGVSA
ncbi:MAG TPA: GntR family transcriptional regulator [Pseudonocardiaceae bacterium]|nr:GntR family transcriptional regulator [Pseudonocardiaceae bacterium]